MGKHITERLNQNVTAGVRFEITPLISLNLEYQYIDTDDVLINNRANSGQFVSSPGKDLDSNVYTMMVNFIF